MNRNQPRPTPGTGDREPLRSWLSVDGGRDPRIRTSFATGIAFASTLSLVALFSLLPHRLPADAGLTVMTVVVVLAGWWATWSAALATAGIAWLMLNGFVVDRYGVLGWHGGDDVLRLAVLLGTAVIVASARAAQQRLRRSRDCGSPDLDLELRELIKSVHRTWGDPNA